MNRGNQLRKDLTEAIEEAKSEDELDLSEEMKVEEESPKSGGNNSSLEGPNSNKSSYPGLKHYNLSA